jgi:acetyltransferase
MAVRNLDKIFNPKRIALFGACEESATLARRVLRNLLNSGFQGVVYPIHPECEALEGVAIHRSLDDLPHLPDLAVICSPARKVAEVVRRCGAAGIPGALILSGGFREAGETGLENEIALRAVMAEYPDLRIIGPNSLGIIRPALGFNASHAVTMPKAGHLAFISESRALCNSVMDWAAEEGIGFSTFVSIGNMLDVGFGALIDQLGRDPATRAIILYVQSIQHARRFMSAARAFALEKPIVVYKAGRFAESAIAAASHTGAMVAEDNVYEAAFERAGVVRVNDLDDVFDVAELLACQRLPKGSRLAIISNAGGPAVIATDALLARGGSLARLEDSVVERLDEVLVPIGSHCNPVDLLDGAPPQRFHDALKIVLDSGQVDGVLVIYATQGDTDPQAIAAKVAEAARGAKKPVLAAWLGGNRVRSGVQTLNEAGLPTHSTPEQAVRAFMHLVSYAHNLQALYETPREVPMRFEMNRRKLRKRLKPWLCGAERIGTECQAKAMLKAYGIPVCETATASSSEEAVTLADRLGYPVVLKVVSPQILHKSKVHGVALDLKTPAQVRSAFGRIISAACHACPDAHILGVSVQRMVDTRDAIELILGTKRDPTFGSVIMVGMGGIATHAIHDRAVGLPPLNERLARRMLESLRVWPMLHEFEKRGLPGFDALIETIIRFSMLVADYPEIREFDVNPILLTADRVLALDASKVLDATPHQGSDERYPHLAIRPYPEEYVRHVDLGEGVRLTLRSMRAEDEPLWHALIANSSPESIRFRFRSLFKRSTHDMAIQHCVLDHERQISIVADTEVDGRHELVGVAQLLAEPDHEVAEFAVLVPDPWQGRKIGGLLLDYSLALASAWGIRRVIAETDPHNFRMLEAFRNRGFDAEIRREEEVVLLERRVASSASVAVRSGPAIGL